MSTHEGAVERWLAWRYLATRQREGFVSFIAVFSLIGIALGVATLIVVLSVMDGFEGELKKRLMSSDLHILATPKAGLPGFERGRVARSAELDRQVRALTPWPGTSVFLGEGGERLKVKRVVLRPEVRSRPGMLFESAGRLFIGAADGCLEVLELQPENRKPVSGSDFANGARLQPREKFDVIADNGHTI